MYSDSEKYELQDLEDSTVYEITGLDIMDRFHKKDIGTYLY